MGDAAQAQAQAQAQAARVQDAVQQRIQGRMVTARATTQRVLAQPGLGPRERTAALILLLDLCVDVADGDCLAKWSSQLAAAHPKFADYYQSAARALNGPRRERLAILHGEVWREDDPLDLEVYLRRQLLAAQILAGMDHRREASQRVDRILSLLAALKAPWAQRPIVARTVVGTVEVLTRTGETERALGVLRASAPLLSHLPPTSMDAARLALVEAELLEAHGDADGAQAQTALAAARIASLELDPRARRTLAGRALALQSGLCLARGDMACADEALTRKGDEGLPRAQVHSAAASALAMKDGPSRDRARAALGARIIDAAKRATGAAPATWWRPGVLDKALIAFALKEGGVRDPETAFALIQLAGRAGPSFDADALTAMGQARSDDDRRAVRQLLRLKARRDRLERDSLRAMAARVGGSVQSGPSGPLPYDVRVRFSVRTLDQQIETLRGDLAGRGVELDGANLVSLEQFRSVLGPGEAALAVAPAGDGLVHACVRRDGLSLSFSRPDAAQLARDTRLLSAALNAGHAPSATLDAQFPVEAASRLYGAVISPVGGCLRPGDRIVALSNVAAFGAPLAVLLERAPPKRGKGYDLSQADWLIRRHAIAFAGTAGAVIAARTAQAHEAADFDFLGVGDPVLGGPVKGVRGVETLAALPETRAELEDSARGFTRKALLLGPDATEKNFRRQLIGDYAYLSFATHGLIREDLPGLSEPALVLSPNRGNRTVLGEVMGVEDDGLLTAPEIAALDLKARFVALSACNTANFDLSRISQDLPALASAFAVAGTPSTLGTLWPVDSETSRRVVAEVFTRLREGAGAAEALAEAQRSFLAAPPGVAWLHPRFWAPFVIMGEGSALKPAPSGGAALTSVETLTRGGGEVLTLTRSDAGLAARLIGDADRDGFASAEVRLFEPAGGTARTWKQPGIGTLRPLVQTADGFLVAGYRLKPGGAQEAILQIAAPDGRLVDRADVTIPDRQTGVLAARVLDRDRAAVLVYGQASPDQARNGGKDRVRLLLLDRTDAPRALADVERPRATAVLDGTLTSLGTGLLLTHSDRLAMAGRRLRTVDDYDQPLCFSEPVTWLELRDATTGDVRNARGVRGLLITSSFVRADGSTILAGALSAECEAPGDWRAAIFSVDPDLTLRPIYVDRTLGGSEVRAVVESADRALVAVAFKASVIDQRLGGGAEEEGAHANRINGLVLWVGPEGSARSKLLAAGADVFLNGVDVAASGEVTIGGSVGGQAALLRLSPQP